MNVSNIIRAILLAAAFGVAILLAGGFLARLGRSAGAAAKAAV